MSDVEQLREAERYRPNRADHYAAAYSTLGDGSVVAVCACGWACIATDDDDQDVPRIHRERACGLAIHAHAASYGERDGVRSRPIEPCIDGWGRSVGLSHLYAWSYLRRERASRPCARRSLVAWDDAQRVALTPKQPE